MKNAFLRKSVAIAGLGLIAAAAQAQTVTVDPDLASPDGTTTFNTLLSAIQSFSTGGTNHGNAAANLIKIKPGTPIIEKLSIDAEHPSAPIAIDGDLTIEGDGDLAVIAGQPLDNTEQVLRVTTIPALPGFAWRQPVNLTVRNVAFIPTDPTQMSIAIFRAATTPAGEFTISFEDCVFTANNGSNAPVTTTGQDDPDMNDPSVIKLAEGGDGMFILSRAERGDLVTNFTNTIVASFGQGTNADGIIGFMNGTAGDFINCVMNINEGCVFANITGRGIQNPYGGYVNVQGTETNPVVFRNIAGTSAIWMISDGETQPTATKIDYANFYNLTGTAVQETAGFPRGFIADVTNSKFGPSAGDAMGYSSAGTVPPNGEAASTQIIDNCVFHNTGSGSLPSQIYTFANFNRTLNVTNSIFTGAGKNGIGSGGTAGMINVSNSIMSMNGPNALGTKKGGVGEANINIDEATVTEIEVSYVNETDPFSPDFLKVVTSDVNDWSVY